MSGQGYLALASQASGRAVRHPGVLLFLVLAHAAVATLSWLWSAQVLGPVLRDMPAPDLFTWMALVQQEHDLLGRLLLAGGCALVLQLVVGALAADITLGAFAGVRRVDRTHRPFLRILLLRLMLLATAAAMLAGLWFTVAPLSERFHEQDNELWIMALHLLTALPFLLPLLFILCVAHYAQALLVRQRVGVFRALQEGLKLVHARPAPALGLWLTGWGFWIAVAAALTLPGLESVLVAQIAVAIRIVIHLWMYAAAWELSTLDSRLSTT